MVDRLPRQGRRVNRCQQSGAESACLEAANDGYTDGLYMPIPSSFQMFTASIVGVNDVLHFTIICLHEYRFNIGD